MNLGGGNIAHDLSGGREGYLIMSIPWHPAALLAN